MSGKISGHTPTTPIGSCDENTECTIEDGGPWRAPSCPASHIVSSIGAPASHSIELQINNEWKVPVWCNSETPSLRTRPRTDPVSKAGTLRRSPICLLGFGVFMKMASQDNKNNTLWSECLCVCRCSHLHSFIASPVSAEFKTRSGEAFSLSASLTVTRKLRRYLLFVFLETFVASDLLYSSGLESP